MKRIFNQSDVNTLHFIQFNVHIIKGNVSCTFILPKAIQNHCTLLSFICSHMSVFGNLYMHRHFTCIGILQVSKSSFKHSTLSSTYYTHITVFKARYLYLLVLACLNHLNVSAMYPIHRIIAIYLSCKWHPWLLQENDFIPSSGANGPSSRVQTKHVQT